VSGFVPRGLEIITSENRSERFVVGGRKKWKVAIESEMRKKN
jgi:hypothetical protein